MVMNVLLFNYCYYSKVYTIFFLYKVKNVNYLLNYSNNYFVIDQIGRSIAKIGH